MAPATPTASEALDVQAQPPAHALELADVRAEGLVRQMTIAGAADGPLPVTIRTGCSLPADQRGAHISRFAEAVDDVAAGAPRDPLTTAMALAEAVRAAQNSDSAWATLEAPAFLQRTTPASGRATLERATVLACARVGTESDAAAPGVPTGVHWGVQVWGITACPCAQAMVADTARERLAAREFDDAAIETILDTVPLATHNQRARATLEITAPLADGIARLADIAWGAVSAPIHDLLKRPDELAVVLAAHERPMFVEDSVRAMLAAAGTALDDLDDSVQVTATQVNFESIHTHEVAASHSASLGSLRNMG